MAWNTYHLQFYKAQVNGTVLGMNITKNNNNKQILWEYPDFGMWKLINGSQGKLWSKVYFPSSF